jgi:hypothetical protein
MFVIHEQSFVYSDNFQSLNFVSLKRGKESRIFPIAIFWPTFYNDFKQLYNNLASQNKN